MLRLSSLLLLLATFAAAPSLATAARLPPEAEGPPVGTTIEGFDEVLGPMATEPGHAEQFVEPRPEPCPSCPPENHQPPARRTEPAQH